MTIVEIKTGNPSPEIAKAQMDNYKRMVGLTTDTDTKTVMHTPSKTEIEKLEGLIKERHPDWNIEVSPMYDGNKIVLLSPKGKYLCDVVCHRMSYGGKEGLLEWWDCTKRTEPKGWLSAEEALALFEEELKDDEKLLKEEA